MEIRNLIRAFALTAALGAIPSASFAQFSIGIGININVAPPELPVYVQPVCPAPNLIWTPGFWAYGDDGYYWVPGTWVAAPQPGYLWTPGYWGWNNGIYVFNNGYWGTHVGFYGGVNYGFGYGGIGFVGGEWRGGSFAYNTAVMNVDRTVIHNTYINKTVIINNTVVNNRTSFNGGPQGINRQPTPQERSFSSERHVQPSQAQLQHVNFAKQDRANYAAVNHGMPAHAALARPATSTADFNHAVAARGAKPAPFTPVKPGSIPKPAAASRPGSPAPRPNTEARPAAPAARPSQENRPAPAARPATRPAQESRPAPAARPAPQARPQEARPAARPAQAARPAPQAKPQQHPAEHPQEEKHPNR